MTRRSLFALLVAAVIPVRRPKIVFRFVVTAWDGEDVDRTFRTKIIPAMKRALELNQAGR